MNFRNPVYNPSGTIDCEIEHAEFGWIPFTASPDDIEESGRLLFEDIKNSGVEIAPYVPPSPEELLALEREALVAGAVQLKMALAESGKYDAAEQFIAGSNQVTQIAWREARELRRLSPVVLDLGKALTLTDVQLDELFRAAAEIEV